MTDVQGTSIDAEPLAATVSALLEDARWMLDEERAHGEGLDTRLGQLTVFAGVILALVVPMGTNGLFGASSIFFDVPYLGSLALLAGSGGLAVTALVRTRVIRLAGKEVAAPWRRVGMADDVLDKFGGEFAAEPTVEIERRMIVNMVEAIRDQRDLNGRRWNLLKIVALGMAGALLMVAVQGVVLVFAW